jgi:hypothetical protein
LLPPLHKFFGRKLGSEVESDPLFKAPDRVIAGRDSVDHLIELSRESSTPLQRAIVSAGTLAVMIQGQGLLGSGPTAQEQRYSDAYERVRKPR